MHFAFMVVVYLLAVVKVLDIAEAIFLRLRRSWRETIPSFDGPENRYREIERAGVRQKDEELWKTVEQQADDQSERRPTKIA